MITFHIPPMLRTFTSGRAEVALDAGAPTTVAAALGALFAACPGVRDRVVTETGEVRQHVNVFVGSESIRYTGGLATTVASGADISIVPAVSGGV